MPAASRAALHDDVSRVRTSHPDGAAIVVAVVAPVVQEGPDGIVPVEPDDDVLLLDEDEDELDVVAEPLEEEDEDEDVVDDVSALSDEHAASTPTNPPTTTRARLFTMQSRVNAGY